MKHSLHTVNPSSSLSQRASKFDTECSSYFTVITKVKNNHQLIYYCHYLCVFPHNIASRFRNVILRGLKDESHSLVLWLLGISVRRMKLKLRVFVFWSIPVKNLKRAAVAPFCWDCQIRKRQNSPDGHQDERHKRPDDILIRAAKGQLRTHALCLEMVCQSWVNSTTVSSGGEPNGHQRIMHSDISGINSCRRKINVMLKVN